MAALGGWSQRRATLDSHLPLGPAAAFSSPMFSPALPPLRGSQGSFEEVNPSSLLSLSGPAPMSCSLQTLLTSLTLSPGRGWASISPLPDPVTAGTPRGTPAPPRGRRGPRPGPGAGLWGQHQEVPGRGGDLFPRSRRLPACLGQRRPLPAPQVWGALALGGAFPSLPHPPRRRLPRSSETPEPRRLLGAAVKRWARAPPPASALRRSAPPPASALRRSAPPPSPRKPARFRHRLPAAARACACACACAPRACAPQTASEESALQSSPSITKGGEQLS
ncbi:unnamed protein product [Nyctereutes procyonoides]|uniref:(raccoon dog) hypothetical protein n=1 Tax=Nyctereutes procyonoides TaxID=34880 RepID=A0A811Z583_NYCPR|nr:unnamed protein product [Nyctereutes procyonoides]